MPQQPHNVPDDQSALSDPDGNLSLVAQAGPRQELSSGQKSDPLVTIFAVPKPFGRDTDLIQRNAIKSWARLHPEVDVILIGDEAGIAETANELGVRHAEGLEFNDAGTPIVRSAFEIARRESSSPFLCYCNSDVILLKDFVRTVRLLAEDPTFDQFVAFGQRTDLRVDHEIEFDRLAHIEKLLEQCRDKGRLCSNVCKEYFVFNRELYADVPDFAIGRGNWDNWMIHSAKQKQLPVVRLSKLVTAIHQSHDYSHSGLGRFRSYVTGDEARMNKRLAGGSHIVSGSTATWRMTESGLRRERPLLINSEFWLDIPRFARLILNMLA